MYRRGIIFFSENQVIFFKRKHADFFVVLAAAIIFDRYSEVILSLFFFSPKAVLLWVAGTLKIEAT